MQVALTFEGDERIVPKSMQSKWCREPQELSKPPRPERPDKVLETFTWTLAIAMVWDEVGKDKSGRPCQDEI